MPAGELNAFGLTQYDNQTSFFGGNAVLSQVWWTPDSILPCGHLSRSLQRLSPLARSSVGLYSGFTWKHRACLGCDTFLLV